MMDGGTMDGMSSLMAWMMGLGLLGWVLVIALLVTIVILLVELVKRRHPRDRPESNPPDHDRGEAHR